VEESGTSGSPVRFQSMVSSGTLRAPPEARRHSEAGGLASLVPPLAVQPKRKSSEQLCVASGIVCTNSDLRTLLSLTSSAQEINTAGGGERPTAEQPQEGAAATTSGEKRSKLKDARSSSFDVAMLQDDDGGAGGDDAQKSSKISPTSWFTKRHQPMSKKDEPKMETPRVTFTAPVEEVPVEVVTPVVVIAGANKGRSKRSHSCVEAAKKLMWDRPSGSVVDAHILGSVIEDFLRRGGEVVGGEGAADVKPAEAKGGEKGAAAAGGCEQQAATPSTSSGAAPPATPTTSSASAAPGASTGSSICSTLKDLFVK
jgi:hypothetical protein